MKRRRRSSPARAAMKMLCLMLGVILAIMVSATVYFQSQIGLLPSLGDLQLELPNLSLPELNLGKPGQIGGTGSGIVNILLIGQDRREGEARARSDSMILCTFNKKSKQIIMTSFLRDLYVPIPGHGSNRINAAYTLGGMELLNDTLEENFGIHIDGNVEVDFGHFAQIIDALGGVEMELRQDEADFINKETGSSLSAGVQLMNGEQALMYSRIRKLDADGDFSRTDRQRKVMSALFSTYRNSGISTMLSLIKEIRPMLDTDIGSIEMMVMAMDLVPMLADAQVVSQYVPSAGTYADQSINGMSVLVPDVQAVHQMLESTLLPQ